MASNGGSDRLLKPARSISKVGRFRWNPRLEERSKPDEHLGKHVLVFYWHGRLALQDSLLLRFFEVASDELRGQVLASIGQDLRADPDSLDSDVAERLRNLWKWRFEVARGDQPDNYKKEMAAFGWTFASGALGNDWELAQLEAALNIAGKVEIDHLVVERLAPLADEFPATTVRCLA